MGVKIQDMVPDFYVKYFFDGHFWDLKRVFNGQIWDKNLFNGHL